MRHGQFRAAIGAGMGCVASAAPSLWTLSLSETLLHLPSSLGHLNPWTYSCTEHLSGPIQTMGFPTLEKKPSQNLQLLKSLLIVNMNILNVAVDFALFLDAD